MSIVLVSISFFMTEPHNFPLETSHILPCNAIINQPLQQMRRLTPLNTQPKSAVYTWVADTD